jgi:hypothetical protein
MAPHYIITVSEGRFRVLERFARPGQMSARLREVASHDFMPLAGAPGGRGGPRPGYFGTNLRPASRGEEPPPPIPDEDKQRAVEWLAEQIEHFLIDRPGQAWAFAAGPDLHNPILSRLRPSVLGSLVETVHRNLSLTPLDELAVHFKVRI